MHLLRDLCLRVADKCLCVATRYIQADGLDPPCPVVKDVVPALFFINAGKLAQRDIDTIRAFDR